MKCVVCGKEGSYFCDDCKKNITAKQLCFNMAIGINVIRENIVPDVLSVMNDILVDVASPEKEIIMIKSFVYKKDLSIKSSNIIKDLLLNNYDKIMESNNINDEDKYVIDCALIRTYFYIQEYKKAYDIAIKLLNNKIPNECIYTLMDYFTYIRNYNLVHKLYDENNDGSDSYAYFMNECNLRESKKKKEYIPAKAEHKEAYIRFMESIGYVFEEKNVKHSRNTIKDEDYPEVEFIDEMNFNSFVAYDLETSGLSEKRDCIVEIGAVKVVDGKVVDSEKFRFQELIHPYAGVCKICKTAEEKTGISIDMVKDARTIVEVFNDFADFIGDDILVGYNNKAFDSIRLRRAGRYAHRIITNKQFDLMPVAKKALHTSNYSLEDIADKYGIVNPDAHRAYADALTTAKVFMKLKS